MRNREFQNRSSLMPIEVRTRSLLVALLLDRRSVPAAINFDRQIRFATKEIESVISDRMVAPKFISAESAVGQPGPHELFSPSAFLAQSASALNLSHDRSVPLEELETALTLALSPEERELHR